MRNKDKESTHQVPIRTLQSLWGWMLSEWSALAGLIFGGQCTAGRHRWAARNTDDNVNAQQLQTCAWLIPDVFKIQTTFRNLNGAPEGNKTDGVASLPSITCFSFITLKRTFYQLSIYPNYFSFHFITYLVSKNGVFLSWRTGDFPPKSAEGGWETLTGMGRPHCLPTWPSPNVPFVPPPCGCLCLLSLL